MVRRPERFLNAHWLNPAYIDPAGRAEHARRHVARGLSAHARAARVDRQGAGRVRADARLHRAAAAGAGHERGRAHGRGRRRQRRGHRQGDALRPRPALRGARRGRVHRLRRRRHPATTRAARCRRRSTPCATQRPRSSAASSAKAVSGSSRAAASTTTRRDVGLPARRAARTLGMLHHSGLFKPPVTD